MTKFVNRFYFVAFLHRPAGRKYQTRCSRYDLRQYMGLMQKVIRNKYTLTDYVYHIFRPLGQLASYVAPLLDTAGVRAVCHCIGTQDVRWSWNFLRSTRWNGGHDSTKPQVVPALQFVVLENLCITLSLTHIHTHTLKLADTLAWWVAITDGSEVARAISNATTIRQQGLKTKIALPVQCLSHHTCCNVLDYTALYALCFVLMFRYRRFPVLSRTHR